MTMRISVVIALYNKAAYVLTAVQSALQQSLPTHEVIVVDDGSTDGGAETLAGIDDPRLRIVRQDNGGVSAARNAGIALASGDWVAFLDADDWQHPDLLRGFAQAHQSCPEAGLLGAPFRFVERDARPEDLAWPTSPAKFDVETVPDLRRRWMQSAPFASSSVAIRLELLREMQPCFEVGESYGEDLDLWFRVAERTPVALVCAELAAYRTLGDGLSASNRTVAEPPYLQRMRQRVLSGEIPPEQRESALWFIGQQQLTLARHAVSSAQRMDALGLLVRARSVWTSRRWQMTLLMTLLFPARLVNDWQHARLRRGAKKRVAFVQAMKSKRGWV